MLRLRRSDVVLTHSDVLLPLVAKRCDVFRILTRETHITSEGNITPEGHIAFRASGTHRSKQKSTALAVLFCLEVQAGFEPADNGVADRGLTTWLLHHKFYALLLYQTFSHLSIAKNEVLKIFLLEIQTAQFVANTRAFYN